VCGDKPRSGGAQIKEDGTMRAIFIHGEVLHTEIIRRLADQGIETVYAVALPEHFEALSEAAPTCVLHSLWDAMAGRSPDLLAWDEGSFDPPSRALLDELGSSESIVLQLLERLNYTKKSVHVLRRFYYLYAGYWQHVIATLEPDAVIFPSTPHMGYDYVLYALCRLRGIRTLIVERTHLPDRLLLLDEVFDVPVPGDALDTAAEKEPRDPGADGVLEELVYAENYIDQRNKRRPARPPSCAPWISLLRSLLRDSKRGAVRIVRQAAHPLQRIPRASRYALDERRPRRIHEALRIYRDDLRKSVASVRYERHAAAPDYGTPYIYLPLHFQPERTSIPRGNVYGDQLLAIDTIVRALPEGWMLYVKEHPRQFGPERRFRMGRSQDFYRALFAYPPSKVRILRPSEPSDRLVSESWCVATLTGTSAWEAVRQGIPALVFGHPWYSGCPGVFRATSTDSCTTVLQNIAAGRVGFDVEQVHRFARWMVDNATFRGYFSAVMGSDLPPEICADSYADAIAARLLPGEDRR